MNWIPFLLAPLFFGSAFAIDFDGDGWVLGEEIRYGGSFIDGDADNDGLSDGWEADYSDPFNPDADGDGLNDGLEVSLGSNPLRSDSDNDGRMDGFEDQFDCDGDGVSGLLDTDNDADQLWDGEDFDACNADQDLDSVLDGAELNFACIRSRDCDGDGLPDAQDSGNFSQLRADSFGVGLSDSVVKAFSDAGQEPSGDLDGDAIPDAWESGEGLISWGPFSPTAGTADVLVEFLHVKGPDSGQLSLSFTPAYQQVDTMFTAEGFNFQWIETAVPLNYEPYLSFLDPSDETAFLAIIAQGRMSDNPYVTTVIMNPQQMQQDFGEILGAAHLRSMLAVLDYGTHTMIELEGPQASGEFSPTVESHIRNNNAAYLTALGANEFGTTGANYWFTMNGPDGYTATWEPNWFADGMQIDFNNGQSSLIQPVRARLDTGGLASTIAHEVGHTLGLCHAHVQNCFQNFTSADQAIRHQSTMSYNAPNAALHFLDSEWAALATFLTCPPETPLTLVANGASSADVLADKYRFTGSVLRTCGEFIELEQDLYPRDGTIIAAYPSPAKEPRGGALWFTLYVLAGAATIVASVVLGKSTSDSEDN